MASTSNDPMVLVREMLTESLPAYRRAMGGDRLETLARGYFTWLDKASDSPADPAGGALARQVASYVLDKVREQLEAAIEMGDKLALFERQYARAATELERRERILSFAREMGADDKDLAEDRKAFARWFGLDAVRGRAVRRVSVAEYLVSAYLDMAGHCAARAMRKSVAGSRQRMVWQGLAMEKTLRNLLAHPGDDRVRVSAFRCLARTIRVMAPAVRNNIVEASTLSYIYRAALDRGQNVWIQCEALALLSVAAPDSFVTVMRDRLGRPDPEGKGRGDDIFVRRKGVLLLAGLVFLLPEAAPLMDLACVDPSPYVRQAVAKVATLAEPAQSATLMAALALVDDNPQVRAAAVAESASLIGTSVGPRSLDILAQVLEREQDPFVLWATLFSLARAVEKMVDTESPATRATLERVRGRVLPLLEHLHAEFPDLAVRREAAKTRERLLVVMTGPLLELRNRLAGMVRDIPPGKSRRIPRSWLRGLEPEHVGRVLSALSQEDYGLSLDQGLFSARVYRGQTWGFSFWRAIYEFFHPSPDKRQAFDHTRGRLARGKVRAPSTVMAELTRTKVPGEPLVMADEAGWRPYLPLPSEALRALARGTGRVPIRICTAEGVTELAASPFKRLFGALVMTLRFGKYAALRNWTDKGKENPAAYLDALDRLGLKVTFRPYAPMPGASVFAAAEGESGAGAGGVAQEGDMEPGADPAVKGDPAVLRFFPASLPFSPDFAAGIKDYFFSVYGNTLADLGLFASLMLGSFLAIRVHLSRKVKRARGRIPLVIGGWGTRGKSGVERIKAALFEALGEGLVSKTTGCEALFLYAHPFGRTREMFLFRPYDKATIWEHHNLLLLADKLESDVFLWECMALTPGYVRILQHSWTRDDYSTITNTYPDHEDIQGPAGIDIPQVMADFVPGDSVLVTTESEMFPILEQAARAMNTTVHRAGALEAGLLTRDVLERFPYSEHPMNVALVLRLARVLDIDEDFALKEMADRVIPDIGVLKAFPVARVLDRDLEFVNGMSANERFATLSNWRRMGFVDPGPKPGEIQCTLINNRADRLSRSIMFASIVAEDLSAERHVLIGTNLGGLKGYIDESWERHIENQSLGDTPREALEAMARRLRVPQDKGFVLDRARAMLQGLGMKDAEALVALARDPDKLESALQDSDLQDHAGPVCDHLREQWLRLSQYEDLVRAVEDKVPATELDKAFRDTATRWFEASIDIIEDSHASGEEIVRHLALLTPPGLGNRVMGMQNIKGTGLDFVYRWQAWERLRASCDLVLSGDPRFTRQGLSEMAEFQEYGLLSEHYALATLDKVAALPAAQTERAQAALGLARDTVTRQMELLAKNMGRKTGGGISGFFADLLESFLDAGDAVARRKRAERIYTDLTDERISPERAAIELGALNTRQKGGWLKKRILGFAKGGK